MMATSITTMSTEIITTTITSTQPRSEEHTSELQSQSNLVCRLLLEKKKQKEDRDDPRILQDEAEQTDHHLLHTDAPLSCPRLYTMLSIAGDDVLYAPCRLHPLVYHN